MRFCRLPITVRSTRRVRFDSRSDLSGRKAIWRCVADRFKTGRSGSDDCNLTWIGRLNDHRVMRANVRHSLERERAHHLWTIQ